MDSTPDLGQEPLPRPGQRSRLGLRLAVAALTVALGAGGVALAAAARDTRPDDAAGTAIATATTAPATHATDGAPGEHHHDHGDGAAGDDAQGCLIGGVLVVAGDAHDHATSHGLTLHDATGGVPGPDDCAGAQAFHERVRAAVEPYRDADAARAAGYTPNLKALTDDLPVDHWSRRGSGLAAFDAAQPDGLVYYADGDSEILLGAVFVERGDDLPQPGGAYTVWHDHHQAGCPAERPNCARATPEGAPRMLHVWVFEGALDPFAHSFGEARGRVV
jgi:hypothetical protein